MPAKRGRRAEPPRLYRRKSRSPGGKAQYVILDTDANGRRIEIRTGASEHERAKAAKALEAYLAEKHVPNFGRGHPSEVLIADGLSFYADHLAEHGRGNANIALSIEMLNEFGVGATFDDITKAWCMKFAEWRRARGDARGSNKRKSREPISRKLKASTARNDLTTLAAAQKFCWGERKLTHCVPIWKPDPPQRRPRFLSKSEVARLLLAALGWDLKTGERNRQRINRHIARLILIGIYTGTRKDRMLRLQWVENLDGGWVDLEREILHRRARTEVETKKRAPSVPINPRLLAHLKRWRKLTTQYVIEHDGKPIRGGLFEGFERACHRAGLNYHGQHEADRVVVHTLRHTSVSWLLDKGWRPFDIGEYVGMSAQMVERVYGHVSDDQQRATADAIGRPNVARTAHVLPTK